MASKSAHLKTNSRQGDIHDAEGASVVSAEGSWLSSSEEFLAVLVGRLLLHSLKGKNIYSVSSPAFRGRRALDLVNVPNVPNVPNETQWAGRHISFEGGAEHCPHSRHRGKNR